MKSCSRWCGGGYVKVWLAQGAVCRPGAGRCLVWCVKCSEVSQSVATTPALYPPSEHSEHQSCADLPGDNSSFIHGLTLYFQILIQLTVKFELKERQQFIGSVLKISKAKVQYIGCLKTWFMSKLSLVCKQDDSQLPWLRCVVVALYPNCQMLSVAKRGAASPWSVVFWAGGLRVCGCDNLVLLDFSSYAQMLTDNDLNGLKTVAASNKSCKRSIGFCNHGDMEKVPLLIERAY